jgi:hypothetical protein
MLIDHAGDSDYIRALFQHVNDVGDPKIALLLVQALDNGWSRREIRTASSQREGTW